MAEYSTHSVRAVLRDLGLRKAGRGNGTGHEVWVTHDWLRVKPKLSRKMCAHVDVYALGLALENLGLTSRREFMRKLKER